MKKWRESWQQWPSESDEAYFKRIEQRSDDIFVFFTAGVLFVAIVVFGYAIAVHLIIGK